MRFFDLFFRWICPRSRRNFGANARSKWTNPAPMLQDCHTGLTPDAVTTRYDRQREARQFESRHGSFEESGKR
jgi:hypothetical protein